MHRLPLLLCLLLPLAALAEEPGAEPTPSALSNPEPGALPDNAPSNEADAVQEADERIRALESRLADSEQQRQALAAQLAAPPAVADNSQDEARITRLTQENQRLKLQLREAQANQPARLLSEQQTWYVAGAGTALLAFLLGMLGRGRRRSRREWIN
ncbi:putative coiled-coil protein SlyX [Pseudomonas nitritireducens]|uniref:Putative coiled-coil protein SlyX n=1 Tax=Pseudomonas nitroreducens TaxID=46680 RepID=A0A7W7KJ45_PSENT|nr:translation initiation factor 2 (IF-2, GTPase) [Pseudomonas nitritireducens]MBB4863714.1 putative coiled-coil protein SlyX [Pseudomonas nitritireducens]